MDDSMASSAAASGGSGGSGGTVSPIVDKTASAAARMSVLDHKELEELTDTGTQALLYCDNTLPPLTKSAWCVPCVCVLCDRSHY